LTRSSADSVVVALTRWQAEALRALAALDELPPEVYAAEVLAKHLYHVYTPEVARRATGLEDRSVDADAQRTA
jgi:hypothetical protein